MIKIPKHLDTGLVEYLNKVGFFDNTNLDEGVQLITIIKEFEDKDGWNKPLKYLVDHIGMDVKFWRNFLNNDYVKMWATKKLKEFADIQQRIGMAITAQMASEGDTNAMKKLMEFTGILNQQETNTIIVLHHVDRPEFSQDEVKEGK